MEEPKKLYRSRKNRIFCGVCGGLGEYLGIDATIVRVIAVFLFFTMLGIIAYIVFSIVVPEEPVVIKEQTKEV